MSITARSSNRKKNDKQRPTSWLQYDLRYFNQMCKKTFLCPSTSWETFSLILFPSHSWDYIHIIIQEYHSRKPPMGLSNNPPISCSSPGCAHGPFSRPVALLRCSGERVHMRMRYSTSCIRPGQSRSSRPSPPALFCGERIFTIFCGVFKKKLSTQIGMKFCVFFPAMLHCWIL